MSSALASALFVTPVESLTLRIESGGLIAPLFGLLAGVALTLTPISWPSISAVVALVAPARAAAREVLPAAISRRRAFAVTAGFVIGMDGVIATLSAAFIGLLVLLTRAAILLTIFAIAALTYAGIRLLLARGTALCRRLEALPPDPLRSVSAGAAFALGGCPACAPVSAGVGAAAAVAGPAMSALVIAGFVLGRAVTLYAVAAYGGRWLTPSDPRRARRLDVAVAVLLLVSAAYYGYRLLDGQVITTLPGEGNVLGFSVSEILHGSTRLSTLSHLAVHGRGSST